MNIICPKCGNKIKNGQMQCPYCKTKAQAIIDASNQKAKEIIKARGDISSIVMSKNLPKDVSKKKLLLFSIFLGLFGVHCFYVGRMKRGFLIPLLMFFCVVFISFPETWVLHSIFSGVFAGLLGAISIFCWWYDVIQIFFNRFSIPVVLNE